MDIKEMVDGNFRGNIYIVQNGKDFAYFQGCDPGVSFISEYNPNNGMISVLVSNYGDNVWREMRKVRETMYRTKTAALRNEPWRGEYL